MNDDFIKQSSFIRRVSRNKAGKKIRLKETQISLVFLNKALLC